jgi:hypothetical protein
MSVISWIADAQATGVCAAAHYVECTNAIHPHVGCPTTTTSQPLSHDAPTENLLGTHSPVRAIKVPSSEGTHRLQTFLTF